MKTPVYRLVNAADSVTMLPPGDGVVVSLGWLISFIPKIGKRLRRKLLSYKGYIHCGNMRYLSDCPKGKYTNVKLLYSVSFIYRIKALINNVRSIKSFVSDHSICVYRDKLATIAIKRNP